MPASGASALYGFMPGEPPVEARRAKMEKVEKILQDDAVMLQPVWRPVFTIINAQVKGYSGHPTQYHQFNQVWLDA